VKKSANLKQSAEAGTPLRAAALRLGAVLAVGILGAIALAVWPNAPQRPELSAGIEQKEERQPLPEAEKETIFAGSIQSLDVQTGTCEFTVLVDEMLKEPCLTQKGLYAGEYLCGVDGKGCLTIRAAADTGESHGESMTLRMPPGYLLREAEFESKSGKLEVTGLTAEKLEITVGTAEIEMTDITAEEIECENGIGETLLALAEPPCKISIESGTGPVRLTMPGEPEEYAARIETVAGRIEYDGEVFQDACCRGEGDRAIEIETGTGSVTVTFAKE